MRKIVWIPSLIISVILLIMIYVAPTGKQTETIKVSVLKTNVNSNTNLSVATKNDDGSYNIEFSIQPKLVDGTNVSVGKQ